MNSEEIEVRQMWIAPERYMFLVSETGEPFYKTYDKGMLTRTLPNGTVLEVLNRSKEEAERGMETWPDRATHGT